jgi:hypothetical protein
LRPTGFSRHSRPSRSSGRSGHVRNALKAEVNSGQLRRDRLQQVDGPADLVERSFNKVKPSRRVETRYDKLAANYLAFIKLGSIRIWLRANEPAP